DLAARGAGDWPFILKVGADYSGHIKDLKAGAYLIPAGTSMAGIVGLLTGTGQSTCGTEINYRIGVTATDVLVSELDPATQKLTEVMKFDPVGAVPTDYAAFAKDPDVRLKVTLAEGVTSWQVVDALGRVDFLSGSIKDVQAEGTVAPQQYELVRGQDRAALLSDMMADQSATLTELWAKRADGLPYKTPEEALIMASIVEKETGVPEERAKVASVFLNRMAQGMKLQTDPTVIYGLTQGKGILGRGLRQSELRSNNPYNTYMIEGLPPGPIANPGRAAIEAALHPEKTGFLFFVADGTGGHVFAATLAEHNKNVAKWRKLEAQGSGG
ncbi:MAG: endolytic transglycosylase MltG, partial [Rhodobacteraceae bacterium]|nr:endolytic transglycosylase MltG [Paracoccaceae bacterium]